jgi:hypothetical protein
MWFRAGGGRYVRRLPQMRLVLARRLLRPDFDRKRFISMIENALLN